MPFGRPLEGRSARAGSCEGACVGAPVRFATICRYTCIADGGSEFAHACCSYGGYRSREATMSSVTTPWGSAGRKLPAEVTAGTEMGGGEGW